MFSGSPPNPVIGQVRSAHLHLCQATEMKRGRQLRRPLLVSTVNQSVPKTLIAAPPPGITRSRTIFRYHFGAFDVVMGKRLCTLNRRQSRPCRGRAVAGRGGESIAAVYWCIACGCNRCPKGHGASGNRPRPRYLWSGKLVRRSDHDTRKRGDAARGWFSL
jgi:hypothetical protein